MRKHLHTPPSDQLWARCVICGLAAASHEERLPHTLYVPRAPYRCPRCVTARDFNQPMPHAEGSCRV